MAEPWSRDRWRALSAHLDRALEMAVDARPAWLAGLDDEDPLLAAELRLLLEGDSAARRTRFLERSPGKPEPR